MEAAFDAGRTTSDGGLLLLRELIMRTGLLRQFAGCFTDNRDPGRIEHSVEELLTQRVLGIICGYEDLNDHERLRDDSLLALAVGKADVTGATRKRQRDQGHALAGKSTLNRLELAAPNVDAAERYKKISYDDHGIERLLVQHFLDSHASPPTEIVLDLDATDDPVHGEQEGRFFHGFYGHYCYLPLYVFCGEFLLGATLHTADVAPGKRAVEELERIVSQIQARWPDVPIVVRGDSGFCNDEVMSWCEDGGIDYILGLAQNPRLRAEIRDEMAAARAEHERTGEDARVFKDFRYKTRDSWSRERRVVGKAEYITDKENHASSSPLARRLVGQGALRGPILRPRREGDPHISAASLLSRSSSPASWPTSAAVLSRPESSISSTCERPCRGAVGQICPLSQALRTVKKRMYGPLQSDLAPTPHSDRLES